MALMDDLWNLWCRFRHEVPQATQVKLVPVACFIAMFLCALINYLIPSSIIPLPVLWIIGNISVIALMGFTHPFKELALIVCEYDNRNLQIEYACTSYKGLPDHHRLWYALCVFGLLLKPVDTPIVFALCFVRSTFQIWLLLENEEALRNHTDGRAHHPLALAIFTVTSVEYGAALGKSKTLMSFLPAIGQITQFNQFNQFFVTQSRGYVDFGEHWGFALFIGFINIMWCAQLRTGAKLDHSDVTDHRTLQEKIEEKDHLDNTNHRIWQRCFLWASLMVQIDSSIENTSWYSLVLMACVVVMTHTPPPWTPDQLFCSVKELYQGRFQM